MGGGIDRPALTDDLHQLWLGGTFAVGRWPGQARGAHLASCMIKLFVRPVCRGRPGCRFLVGAEHVRPPTPPRPRWPRGLAWRLPRGLRASRSRHLQGGSCRVSRVLWLLIDLEKQLYSLRLCCNNQLSPESWLNTMKIYSCFHYGTNTGWW